MPYTGMRNFPPKGRVVVTVEGAVVFLDKGSSISLDVPIKDILALRKDQELETKRVKIRRRKSFLPSLASESASLFIYVKEEGAHKNALVVVSRRGLWRAAKKAGLI